MKRTYATVNNYYGRPYVYSYVDPDTKAVIYKMGIDDWNSCHEVSVTQAFYEAFKDEFNGDL